MYRYDTSQAASVFFFIRYKRSLSAIRSMKVNHPCSWNHSLEVGVRRHEVLLSPAAAATAAGDCL